MKRFRYDTSGRWFKGNTHIHSTVSDGGKDFKELAEMYASKGYAFLFRTDHSVPSNVSKDKKKYPLLWIDGVELAGYDYAGSLYHVVCLGTVSGISGNDRDFIADLQRARSQGAFTIMAHPHWTGNSFQDYARWKFDGVEIYNHMGRWLNGKGEGLFFWTEALKNDPDILGFAVDDAHISPEHPGWDGGWIMVNAGKCSGMEIAKAIHRGNFYSSCGPEIHSLRIEEGKLHIETSPVRFVRLVSTAWRGLRKGNFEVKLMTSVTMEIPAEWPFVYLEIEDNAGRRAWTNNLFTCKD